MTDPTAMHDEDHGWIDESGFEAVDNDDQIDEGALG